MTTPLIGEERVERLEVTFSDKGPWVADVWMERDPVINGQVRIVLGKTSLMGQVIKSGPFGARTYAQIVAGKAQWNKVMTPKSYHLDTGVRTELVWQDLLRETGELQGTFQPTADRIGFDYARNAVAASTVLESIIGATSWWVDLDGLTNVGPQPTNTPTKYEVLAHDPAQQSVEIALDDFTELRVGSVLTERVPQPLTVQSFRLQVSALGIRAKCQAVADMPALFRKIVRHEVERLAPQLRKYRVVGMTNDGRVDLRIAQKASGYPDLGSVTMWPGVAGAHAELTAGTEVVVAFVDGDRSQPIIVGFVGKGGAGFSPVKLTFNSNVEIKSGSLKVDSEVTAGASNPATQVTLTQHKHPSGTGPTGTPIPGM